MSKYSRSEATGGRSQGHARQWVVLSSLWMLLGTINSLNAQSLTWLGTLGGRESVATDVSADGSVVVGIARYSNGQSRAFRWTAAGGMQSLGTLPGGDSYSYEAYGVSADGSVVVGISYAPSGASRGFRWTSSAGMQELPTFTYAYDVSADGSVVVGRNTNNQAYRWSQTGGGQSPGMPGRRIFSGYARGVSADGSVAVGKIITVSGSPNGPGTFTDYLFRWTTRLQTLASFRGYSSAAAYGVSGDGAVVVGEAPLTNGQNRAFRWTAAGGMQNLGTLPGGDNSNAGTASWDGAVVVGASTTPSGWSAYRWTAQTEMQNLNVVFGTLLANGSRLWDGRAITPDARFIVGRGVNAATGRLEAYLLDTHCSAHHGDVDGNGCVDDADLLAVLFALGQSGQNLGRVDSNCDGAVDDADLALVLLNFGSGC